MPEYGKISISGYDYHLPPERIAQYPLPERDSSKLLISGPDGTTEDVFCNLHHHLHDHGTLVFNNTRVIRARILFRKETGTTIEIFCLEPVYPAAEISTAFHAGPGTEWKTLVGNLKRWKSDKISLHSTRDEIDVLLTAELREKYDDGTARVRFEWQPAGLSFGSVLEIIGNVPLPPYIRRKPVASDISRYQTIYATHEGSVAAPTAGLHFTGTVMQNLMKKDIRRVEVTLHVGAGTFRNVSADHVNEHRMHQEAIHVTTEAIEKLINQSETGTIAVGTTAARTLESLYWIGYQVYRNPRELPEALDQWVPYEQETRNFPPAADALEALLLALKKRNLSAYQGTTRLMIIPGYQFRILNGLITNFHIPRSTLLLLVAALIGDRWKSAYQYALDHHFRFLSYGDACLFYPDRVK